jgi:ABC-type cobalamin transport system permease subunit
MAFGLANGVTFSIVLNYAGNQHSKMAASVFLGMALAGVFAIILRIVVAAALGSTLTASLIYAGIIAISIISWCVYFRFSMKKNFDSYIQKFEMAALPSDNQTTDENQDHITLLQQRSETS